MREIGAKPLPLKLLEGIRRHLTNAGYGSFSYAFEGERLIGGALCVGLNRVMDYFMGAFDSDYGKSQPNSLLMYHMITYARDHGYHFWNWQSASSPQSGVYHYKAGWGSRDGRHYYLTRVIEDITGFKKVPQQVIKEKYGWHYVMPYRELSISHSMPKGQEI